MTYASDDVKENKNRKRASRSNISERLLKLADNTRDLPAGLYNQMFHARVSFRELFECAPEDESMIEPAVDNWIKLGAYIAAADGFSDIEYQSLKVETQTWNPFLSDERYVELAAAGAKLTKKQAAEQARQLKVTLNNPLAINCFLLSFLFRAGADGLSQLEIKAFREVAIEAGVSEKTIKEIIETYNMECELRRRYLKLELGVIEKSTGNRGYTTGADDDCINCAIL